MGSVQAACRTVSPSGTAWTERWSAVANPAIPPSRATPLQAPSAARHTMIELVYHHRRQFPPPMEYDPAQKSASTAPAADSAEEARRVLDGATEVRR